MTRGKFLMGTVAALALSVTPALAQRSAGGNPSSGSAVSRGGGDSGGGGGVSSGSGGGASSSGGGAGSSVSSPSSSPSSGREYVSAPTRPSERAEARQRSSGGGSRTGGSAVSRGGGDSGGSRSGGDRSSAPTTRSAGSSSGSNPSDRAVPTHSRPRDGRPATGTAVAREFPRVEPPRGGYTYYPGYRRYYWPGYTFGLGYFYDPFWYDPFYYGGSGYYGGYGYPYGGAGYGSGSYDRVGTGALRLKIKPREAEVYVDGYFVGTVDEFDGLFQKLTLDGGGHRIEIRAAGHEVIQFEVLITPGETITYKGELKQIQ
jgi:hypothetical protein